MQTLTLYGRAAVEAARILSLPLALSPDAPEADDWLSCTITPAAMRALPPASVALADALASYRDAEVAAWPTPGEWCDWFLGCCSDDPYPEDCLEAVADRVAAYERATLGRWLVARDRLRAACAWLFRGPAPDDEGRSNIGRWILRRRNGHYWADGLLPIGQHATTAEAEKVTRLVFGVLPSMLRNGVPPECR